MDERQFRQIPKMDRLLARPAVQEAGRYLPRPVVREAVGAVLRQLRAGLQEGKDLPSEAALDRLLCDAITRAGQWKLRRVINATGVVLHTNFGRAPLAAEMAAHVAEVAAGYSTLEYDLETGKRGSRHALVERQLCELTGAEAAMVVNNNAAAVFLMLHTLAEGQSVAVSRGELVEIGGAFRVPEIMAASGARLYEVGTTNKTHLRDYEAALEAGAGALLKVHTSNFKLLGFTEAVSPEALSGLAKEKAVPLLYDLGAGFLVRPELLGLREGEYVPDAVRFADVCCFSGDKLLGAGQAGILLGKREYIEKMKKNQLMRMLRVDKMTLAALEAALRFYSEPTLAREKVPVLQMLSVPEAVLRARAEALAERLRAACPSMRFTAEPCDDEPGGGALPGAELPGWAVRVEIPGKSASETELALRTLPTAVIGRISKGRLLLSVRTVSDEDVPALIEGLSSLEGQA